MFILTNIDRVVISLYFSMNCSNLVTGYKKRLIITYPKSMVAIFQFHSALRPCLEISRIVQASPYLWIKEIN